MKKHIIPLFLLISLVSACTQTKVGNKHSNETSSNELSLVNTTPNDQFIIIGGYRTDFKLKRDIKRTDFHIRIEEGESADFSGIEQLQSTERLDIVLRDTGPIDFSPLKSLPNLKYVNIVGWGLTAIPDLEGISLIWMDLGYGNLASLDGIEKIPSLEDLVISGNLVPLTDISALRYLRNLKSFHFFSGYQTIDFSVLADLSKLKEIRLGGGGEFDLVGISHVQSIEDMWLQSNTSKILDERSTYKNIEEIGKITGLKELYLDESIKSVEFLVGNVNLEELTLIADKERDNYFEVLLPLDVKPLSNLKKLKRLVIRGFELKNIDALDTLLPQLEYFNTDLYELEK